MAKVLHQSMFGFLSAVLLALLFVISPAEAPEVTAFQSQVRTAFRDAAVKAWGNQSVAEPFALIWATTQGFYGQSADQAIALLEPADEIVELVLAFDGDYQLARNIFSAPRVVRAPDEAPLYNIIPMPDDAERLLDPAFSEGLAYQEPSDQGMVLGESTSVGEENGMPGPGEGVEPALPMSPRTQAAWSEIADSITGQPHCVAVFYGTVNSYPGPCAKEEEFYAAIQHN